MASLRVPRVTRRIILASERRIRPGGAGRGRFAWVPTAVGFGFVVLAWSLDRSEGALRWMLVGGGVSLAFFGWVGVRTRLTASDGEVAIRGPWRTRTLQAPQGGCITCFAVSRGSAAGDWFLWQNADGERLLFGRVDAWPFAELERAGLDVGAELVDLGPVDSIAQARAALPLPFWFAHPLQAAGVLAFATIAIMLVAGSA